MDFLPSHCAECGIKYYMDMLYIEEYIDCWHNKELGESMANTHYPKILTKKMPKPCDSCDEEYKMFHAAITSAYFLWDVRYYWEHYSVYDVYDDEPCISNVTLCPCCGDCP